MFIELRSALRKRFSVMKDYDLYRTAVDKDLLWSTYLDSFPPGSNPVFRERTEYDCQACKSFIRAAGSMVAVIKGELVSLWDCATPTVIDGNLVSFWDSSAAYPFDAVAEKMSRLVKSAPIENVFLHDSSKVGIDLNFQETEDGVITWEHLHLDLPKALVCKDQGSVYADRRSTMEVFRRALEEITEDSISTVIDLIEQGSLYRGEEHLAAVQGFRKLKEEWVKLDPEKRKLFVWRQGLPPSLTRIRSSAIGTLLVDLSEGTDLDGAVRSFESKVAPTNYKRPKALVTKSMIERARKTVEELGYGTALSRRFAVMEDITINNVLFANRDARRAMSVDVFDELAGGVKDTVKNLERVERVSINTFIENILPKVSSVELLFENRHEGNLVNLVAPKDPEAKLLFKWPNNFSWSYRGDLADSIKQRVKSRGGSVTGDFRASLAWFNSDDLDLHLIEPSRGAPNCVGEQIWFRNRISRSGSEGTLDIDMNVGAPGSSNNSRSAVENITYPRRDKMIEGQYALFVNQFRHRERIDVGFEIEMEFCGEVSTFSYDREVLQGQNIAVAEFTFGHKDGIKFGRTLPRQSSSKTLWGLPTQKFHTVTIAMLSPNHWDGRPVGNKHYLFMLLGCEREGSSRGFYNEYLSDDLREHRRVFEIIGSKMRTEDKGPQLSGLGFSSTQRNSIYARVSGSFNRMVNIVF